MNNKIMGCVLAALVVWCPLVYAQAQEKTASVMIGWLKWQRN